MAATHFERALALVLRHEGGYVDHPADPGGATNLGITLATLSRHRGRVVDKAEVRALGRDEAASIYRRYYWNVVGGDALSPGADLAVFDCAVNSGPARAARLLQSVLGLRQDGVIGPLTHRACADSDPATLIRGFTAARLAFLRGLATWPVFGRGWTSRVEAVERAALAAASGPSAPAVEIPAIVPEEKTMTDTKSIFSSRTIWANLLGLAALAFPLVGLDTSGIDVNHTADALAQFVAATSFIVSTVFRVTASKRIAG